MTEDFLIKYITGNLNEPESKLAREWINMNDGNRKEFFALKNAYALSKSSKRQLEINEEYKIVARKLNIYSRNKVYPIVNSVLKYAAIVVFAMFLGYSIPRMINIPGQAKMNEIVAPPGQISEIVLSEGTHVWLNSGTSIKFPAQFGTDKREIYISGEAYFEVARDEKTPFIVYAGEIATKVLGTEFNISAYEDANFVETTLVNGSIEILDNSNHKIVRLKPGQQLFYSTNPKNVSVSEVDTHPYLAWKNGELTFRNKTLKELKPKLERWYNVDITFADPKVEEFKFSGTILKDKPFDQVLMAIKLTLPISYQIDTKLNEKNKIILQSLKHNS